MFSVAKISEMFFYKYARKKYCLKLHKIFFLTFLTLFSGKQHQNLFTSEIFLLTLDLIAFELIVLVLHLHMHVRVLMTSHDIPDWILSLKYRQQYFCRNSSFNLSLCHLIRKKQYFKSCLPNPIQRWYEHLQVKWNTD